MTKIQTYTPEADSHFVVRFLDGMLAEDKISCENDNCLPKRRETVIPAHDLIQQADSIH
jgi:hypothetical protein